MRRDLAWPAYFTSQIRLDVQAEVLPGLLGGDEGAVAVPPLLVPRGRPPGAARLERRELCREPRGRAERLARFNRKQVQVDSTGKLTKDGEWLYRFIGVFRDSGVRVPMTPVRRD